MKNSFSFHTVVDLKYSFENLLIFLKFFFFQKELLENIEWNLELNLDSLWVLHTLQNSWLKDDARIFPGLALFKNSVQTQQGKKKKSAVCLQNLRRKWKFAISCCCLDLMAIIADYAHFLANFLLLSFKNLFQIFVFEMSKWHGI